MKCTRCGKELVTAAWWCPRCGMHRSGSGYLPTNYRTGPVNGPLVPGVSHDEHRNDLTTAAIAIAVSSAICALIFWWFHVPRIW